MSPTSIFPPSFNFFAAKATTSRHSSGLKYWKIELQMKRSRLASGKASSWRSDSTEIFSLAL